MCCEKWGSLVFKLASNPPKPGGSAIAVTRDGTRIWIERMPKYKNKQQKYLLEIFSKTKRYLLDKPNLHALNTVIILIDSQSNFIRY